MSNKQYFTESGFLTSEGEELLAPLKKEITKILKGQVTEEGIRIMGSLLTKMVNDEVSDKLTKFAQKQFDSNAKLKELFDMTDEEFDKYLERKYKPKFGELWRLHSLTKEEYIRVPKLTDEQRAKILEEGRKAAEAVIKETPSVKINPHIRIKQ